MKNISLKLITMNKYKYAPELKIGAFTYRFKEAAMQAALAQDEKEISYFAFALLNYAHINLSNGYKISSYSNLIEIIYHDRKVMVIRCEINDLSDEEIVQEFKSYIKLHQFENGIIITSLHTAFYSRGYTVRERKRLCTVSEYRDILMELIDIKVLEFEDI